jgi:chromate transport protein ChrA
MKEITDQTGIISGALGIAAKAFGVWLISWAIRRKGEFDYPLDWIAKLVRWLVVVIAFAITAQFRPSDCWLCRSIALTIGLAFLCWPNLAFHLTKLFRRQADAK